MSRSLRYALAIITFLAGLDLIILSLIFGPFTGGGSVFWLQIIIGLGLLAITFKIKPGKT
jgi:hypothetical protein